MKPDSGDPWKIRRRWLFNSLIWMASMITAIIAFGLNTEPARIFVDTGTWAFVGLIMTYVFGAVADDFLKRKPGRKKDDVD